MCASVFCETFICSTIAKKLTIDDTLIYENLLRITNIVLASYNRADSVLVTSNVTELTENIRICISTSNVYLQSKHSITLDLSLSSACIYTVTDHTSTYLPISVDFDFQCICSHAICKGFFYSRGKPFYFTPVNFDFNFLDHLSLTISIRGQQRVSLSC